jgi:hypothetical protein
MPRKLDCLGVAVVAKHVVALAVAAHWWVCSQAPSAGAAGGTLACATVLWELCTVEQTCRHAQACVHAGRQARRDDSRGTPLSLVRCAVCDSTSSTSSCRHSECTLPRPCLQHAGAWGLWSACIRTCHATQGRRPGHFQIVIQTGGPVLAVGHACCLVCGVGVGCLCVAGAAGCSWLAAVLGHRHARQSCPILGAPTIVAGLAPASTCSASGTDAVS